MPSMEESRTSQEDNKAKNTSTKKNIVASWLFFGFELSKIVLIALVIVLPIRYFLFQPFIVKGESMVPNLQSGDYLIVDEISYRFADPKRGDIVVLKCPLDNSQKFIKRIIGLPQETVEVKNGKVSISKDGKDIDFDETEYLPDLRKTEGSVKLT